MVHKIRATRTQNHRRQIFSASVPSSATLHRTITQEQSRRSFRPFDRTTSDNARTRYSTNRNITIMSDLAVNQCVQILLLVLLICNNFQTFNFQQLGWKLLQLLISSSNQ